jgi:hypothetical protein
VKKGFLWAADSPLLAQVTRQKYQQRDYPLSRKGHHRGHSNEVNNWNRWNSSQEWIK